MKSFKKLTTFVSASVVALSAFTASATPITVGDVTWDPDFSTAFGVSDFNAEARFAQWWTTSSTIATQSITTISPTTVGLGELVGIANITSLNGFSSSFVCSTCSLNLAFGGLTLANPGVDLSFDFANAWFKVFSSPTLVDPFSAGQYLAVQSGLVFLEGNFSNFGLQAGTLNNGFSEGLLNVTGGLALGNFDTDGEANGTDLRIAANAAFVGGSMFAQGSSLTVVGNSIPEPASIALLGLGLLGIGAVSRRRRKA